MKVIVPKTFTTLISVTGHLDFISPVTASMTGDIANQIRLKLLPEEPARAVSPEAYEAYLRGRHELNAATLESDLERSILSFEQAIAKDPQWALGYAGLADSYVTLSDYYRPPREVMPKAKNAAQKALELDEKLSEAHDALGCLDFIYEWNWAAAEQHLKRAIELNSGNALARIISLLSGATPKPLPRASAHRPSTHSHS